MSEAWASQRVSHGAPDWQSAAKLPTLRTGESWAGHRRHGRGMSEARASQRVSHGSHGGPDLHVEAVILSVRVVPEDDQNGRENVKSAPYRPILSANGRRQRPAPAYARADPAQYGQNDGNWPGKCRTGGTPEAAVVRPAKPRFAPGAQ